MSADPREEGDLSREIYPIPPYVTAALSEHRLTATFEQRPAYQQNDYIGWIIRGKREETRRNRVQQMLDELRHGGVYMNMKWSGGNRARA